MTNKTTYGRIGYPDQLVPHTPFDTVPAGWVVMLDGDRPADIYYASSDGHWLPGLSSEQLKESIVQASAHKSKLMTESSNKIDVLRDRIDAGQDKEGELKLWKVYRIELDDVDVSDPVWPVMPE